MNPSLSVIIPVFNAEPYVAECLDSVLGQTLAPTEIVAINDGSTDGSLEILRRYADRIRVVSRENRGLPATLNEGLAITTGTCVAFLDADDTWTPDKLRRQCAALDAEPTLDACFGYVESFVSPELPADIRRGIACPTEPQPGWLKQAMLARRSSFERFGTFNPQYRTGDFIDWFARAKAAGLRYELLPDVVLRRRLSRNSLSAQIWDRSDYTQILKAALDRQRHAS